jgi:DNA-directed RNA polymerase specialized sigma subunit
MSASERQILEALPMVRRMASRYTHTGLGSDDAVGVGAVALVEAARRYDHRRGVPFAGFAFFRVRGAMRDACRAQAGSGGGRPDAEVLCDPDILADVVCDPVAVGPDGWLDLLSAIQGLRYRLRTVVLQHAAGVPHHQIARELDVHESRVSQLLRTARVHLRPAIVPD